MNGRIVTIVLLVGIALSTVLLGLRLAGRPLPGDQQSYEPTQPIAFSHRIHAGELQIQCLFCHAAADRSRHAGIPAASTCMNCHRWVTAARDAVRAEEELAEKERRDPRRLVSPELQKLYDALALDERLVPARGKSQVPIAWVKVHNLADFVYFDHRPHVSGGVTCQVCHGAIDTMERVRQTEPLSMGWCVNCHRRVNREGVNGKSVHASVDCVTCHY